MIVCKCWRCGTKFFNQIKAKFIYIYAKSINKTPINELNSYLFQPMFGVKSNMVEVMNLSKQMHSKTNMNEILKRKFFILLNLFIVFNLSSFLFLNFAVFYRLFDRIKATNVAFVFENELLQHVLRAIDAPLYFHEPSFKICQMLLNELTELNARDEHHQ